MKKIYVCYLLCLSVMMSYAQEKNKSITSINTTKTVVPFIDQLQNGEKFTVHYKSTGCFHSNNENMTFQRENDVYFVICNKQKKKLTADFMESIRNFETELAQKHDLGCTTVDNYLVIYNDVHRVITDGSCNWNGYQKLKKLFGFVA
ncbi:MAG: hypothetical protein AAF617_09610 [Bacteroidota bacterium]